MPVKRSRIGRSSSFGEAGVLNRVSPPLGSPDLLCQRHTAPPSAAASRRSPTSSGKAFKVCVAEKPDESRPRILTFSSPVQKSVDVNVEEPICGFLDKCFYCKKKIRENAEVFMYSYLRAFCTAECRDMQIAMDNAVENVREKSKEIPSHSQGMNIVKDQIGF